MRWQAIIIGLVAAAAADPSRASAASPRSFKLVARSTHVAYWAESGQRVDVTRNEAFLERLGTLFTPPPEGWGIEYYRHSSADDLGEHFGYSVSGITDLASARIDSIREFHPHELVHAVTGRFGHPPAFFAEGLAVALASRGSWRGQDPDEIAAREMAVRGSLEPFLSSFGEQEPAVAYAVAGSFVAFLLDRNGIAPIEAFVRGCGASPLEYEQAFRRAYGRSVASLTNEWMAELRRGTGARQRAWYEPARWPEALRRGMGAPAAQALAVSAPRAGGPPAAEPAGGAEP